MQDSTGQYRQCPDRTKTLNNRAGTVQCKIKLCSYFGSFFSDFYCIWTAFSYLILALIIVEISAFLSAFLSTAFDYELQELSFRGNLSECVRQHAAVCSAVFRSTSNAMIDDCAGIFNNQWGLGTE
jgi:hypothetical protein